MRAVLKLLVIHTILDEKLSKFDVIIHQSL